MTDEEKEYHRLCVEFVERWEMGAVLKDNPLTLAQKTEYLKNRCDGWDLLPGTTAQEKLDTLQRKVDEEIERYTALNP